MALHPEISFRLHVAVKEDEHAKCFVSWCPTIGVFSAGNTADDAKKAIESAILMFIKNCLKRRILDDVLVERGFVPDEEVLGMLGHEGPKQQNDTDEYISVRLREFGGEHFPVNISVPLALLMAQECRA